MTEVLECQCAFHCNNVLLACFWLSFIRMGASESLLGVILLFDFYGGLMCKKSSVELIFNLISPLTLGNLRSSARGLQVYNVIEMHFSCL